MSRPENLLPVPCAHRLVQGLADLDLWVVTGLVAASMAWSALLPAAAMSGLVFYLLRLAGEGWRRTRTPADPAIIFLAATGVISLAWVSVLPEKTTPQVWRLLAGMGFFYTLVHWANTPSRLRLLGAGAVLLALALSVFAPLGVIWAMKLSFIPAGWYERFTPLVADTANPNVLAGSLVLFLPLPVAILLYGWKELSVSEKVLALATALLGSTMLVLTQSRGAWLAYALALALLILLRGRWGWLAAGLALLAGTALLLYLGPAQVGAMILGSQGGLDMRQEIWLRAVYMLEDFPFTGVGMGLYGEVANTLYPFSANAAGLIPHAHNLFLQVGVDLGLPGLIAWCSILLSSGALAWQLHRLARRLRAAWLSGLGAGLLGGLLALVVHGLLDAVTWGQVRSAPLVWGLCGLVAAAANIWLTAPLATPAPQPAAAERVGDV